MTTGVNVDFISNCFFTCMDRALERDRLYQKKRKAFRTLLPFGAACCILLHIEEARTCEAWFHLTFRPQKWNLKVHMWYQLSPFPKGSNVANRTKHKNNQTKGETHLARCAFSPSNKQKAKGAGQQKQPRTKICHGHSGIKPPCRNSSQSASRMGNIYRCLDSIQRPAMTLPCEMESSWT